MNRLQLASEMPPDLERMSVKPGQVQRGPVRPVLRSAGAGFSNGPGSVLTEEMLKNLFRAAGRYGA
jgi:hypothetical protein